ncbi:MAG: adenine deaminase [bacterium]
MELGNLISIARGEKKAELVIKNAKVVNVLSGEIYLTSVAISEGKIVGLGDYAGEEEIDINGAILAPGFIDGHIHIESSKLKVSEFAKVVLSAGTTAVVIDPHEIANVAGLDGIRYMLDSSKYTPLDVFVMLPSCVPATNMETSGATLTASDLAELIAQDTGSLGKVLGIAEVMNYPGVLFRVPEVLDKIALGKNRPIDGHAPYLSGKDLCAYILAGIQSDHECTNLNEAKEKLRLGMHLMIREGTTAKNLKTLLPLVTPQNSRQCMFVTDDISAADLFEKGHINAVIKKAIVSGLDPITAIQMGTLNPAQYFGLKNMGAIAPGYQADLVSIDNLEHFNIKKVFKKGKLVAENGLMQDVIQPYETPPKIKNSVHIDFGKIKGFQLELTDEKMVKVIEVIPDQIITKKVLEVIKTGEGDISRDILKIVVIERHNETGNVGIGFVKGFGLLDGAIGSSVAHDSHNIIIVGTNDENIMTAAIEIAKMGGGEIVVAKGEIKAFLPLPIAGLISEEPIEVVKEKELLLIQEAKKLGCSLNNPFMTLSFLALPVIPELKLTDKGLVDVVKFQIVPLFGE